MGIYEKIIFYLTAPKCVHCGERMDIDDLALCKRCRAEYNDAIRRSCYVCAQPLYECTCTNKYLDSHYVHKHIKVYRYLIRENLVTNNLIYSLKRDNRKDVLEFLSTELASSIIFSLKNPENYVLTSIPRIKRSTVRYGIDHAELLAKAVAKKIGATYVKLLKSKGKREQKHARGREERIKNLNLTINERSDAVKDKNVIIIDDIVTTGVSMSVAAMLLKSIGAKRIIAASVASAYKDELF